MVGLCGKGCVPVSSLPAKTSEVSGTTKATVVTQLDVWVTSLERRLTGPLSLQSQQGFKKATEGK